MRTTIAKWLAAACLVIAAALIANTSRAETLGTPEAAPKYCAAFEAHGGFPRHQSSGSLGHLSRLCRPGYALLHNGATRNPYWVIEILNKQDLDGEAKRKNNFRTDPSLTKDVGATPDDYKKAGFDRGHMAPAADFKHDQGEMNDSFFMTNMSPQIGPSFNRGIWAHLEKRVRGLAKTRGRLVVLTGPIYEAFDMLGEDFIGPGKEEIGDKDRPIRVPDGYYKILYDPKRKRALAFALPNQRLPGRDIEDFRVTIRHIEDMTGLNFFPKFAARDQNILEAHEGEMWRW